MDVIGTFNLLKYFYILIRFKMQPFTKSTVYILICILISIFFIVFLPNNFHPFLKGLVGSIFSIIVFSFINYKYNIVEEVNKVYKRFGIIK